MAEFNQDLVIFEDDTLLLRYTFTDLETDLTTGMGYWWGAFTSSGWPPSSDGEFPNCAAHNSWTTNPGTIASTGNVTVTSPNIVNIQFTQNMFEEQGGYVSGSLETDVEYYTELVFSPTANESDSVVVATGLLFISHSMFSIAGYRP